jgi:hypothetical protein
LATFDYFPFESGEGAFITEPRWTDMFTWMRTVGVLSEDTTLAPDAELAVNPADPSTGTQVQVEDGEAFIQGFMFIQEDGPEVIDIPLNESGDPRIDLLVLRLDKENDIIFYVDIEGDPDPSPVPPDPIQNSTIWDLPLAEIAVADGATEITSMDITDVRVRSVQGDGGSSAVTLTSGTGDQSLVSDGVGPDLSILSLSEGSNISFSADANTVTISAANAPSDSPICFVYKNATTTGLTDGSTTTISFDTSILNPNSMWDSMTNPNRITIGESGVYLIHALVGWVGVALANGPVEIQILVNGSTTIGRSRILLVGADTLYLNSQLFYSLSATDYLTLNVINSSGQTLSLSSSTNGPSLQALKLRS